ncbi:MAG: ATP-grasp domain-containing protein [Burkholderiaceae bacterium]|nr:ATP-grasp domain-containing protein [Burkholderiaceae bacterium]
MISKILIANRGEIACRIMQTCRRMGIRSVAVFSEADQHAMHVAMADEAVHIGGPLPAESYLNIDALIRAAVATGAQAIHPGYGFLSENSSFAQACASKGIVFVGPPAKAIDLMGSKSAAKLLMDKIGVPTVPGYNGEDQSLERLKTEAQRVGFPIMIKAVAGGGGRGIRIVEQADGFEAALLSCQREAKAGFADDRVLIERYLPMARHIEVQVFADGHGNAVHLFERDCSTQRRHQKLIEESPAPGLSKDQREAICSAAVKAVGAIDYRGAGTVEFIAQTDVEGRVGEFYFMEMNTRLQVEHPVTEMVTGLDLVEWQIRVARGEPLPLAQSEISTRGHAIEVRICAEDATRDFLPATGRISYLRLPVPVPGHVRVDTGVQQGDEVTLFYDSMLTKLICWAPDRNAAIARLQMSLQHCVFSGVGSNVGLHRRILALDDFSQGRLFTGLMAKHWQTLQARAAVDVSVLCLAVAGVLGAEQEGHSGVPGGVSPHRAADPWALHDGWRLFKPTSRSFDFLLCTKGADSERAIVELHHLPTVLKVLDQEQAFRWVRLDQEGSLLVHFGGTTIKGQVRVDQDNAALLHVRTSAGEYDLQLMDLYGAGEGLDDADASLRAPMPGLVLAVMCKPGDAVKKGAPLMVLSAMKLEQTIAAPRDGVIEEIFFSAQEQVTEGAMLLKFLDAPSVH